MAQLPDQSLPKGAHIGVYEINDVIRSDSFGYTYRAWNEHLNTYVSLKEYFPTGLAVRKDDAQSMQASAASKTDALNNGLSLFLKQAEILNTLQHPNIITVHNVLQHNNTAYMAMDDELGSVLSSNKNKHLDKENIFRTLVDALKHIHDKGTLHGDLHPKAILIDNNSQPVIIEFAAARMAFAAQNDNLEAEIRPGYSAAELNKQHTANESSDIYALGATMYRFITQKQPKSALARLQAFETNNHDPLPSIFSLAGPANSKGFLNTINLMLCPDSAQRPHSCAEVLAHLNEHSDSEANSSNATTVQPSQTTAHAEEKQSGIATWIGTAAVILVLLGLGFWFIAQPNKDAKQTTQLAQQHPAAPQEQVISERSEPETLEVVAQQQEVLIEVEPSNSDVSAIPVTTEPVTAEPVIAEAEPAPNTANVEITEQATSMTLNSATDATNNTEQEQIDTQTSEAAASETSDVATEVVLTTEAEAAPRAVSEVNEQQIDAHIADAEENIKSFKLTTPADSNAYDHYQAILEIDPENPEADGGLQQIVEKYVWLINKAIRTKQPRLAQIYLKRALKVAPQDPTLIALAEKLEVK